MLSLNVIFVYDEPAELLFSTMLTCKVLTILLLIRQGKYFQSIQGLFRNIVIVTVKILDLLATLITVCFQAGPRGGHV